MGTNLVQQNHNIGAGEPGAGYLASEFDRNTMLADELNKKADERKNQAFGNRVQSVQPGIA